MTANDGSIGEALDAAGVKTHAQAHEGRKDSLKAVSDEPTCPACGSMLIGATYAGPYKKCSNRDCEKFYAKAGDGTWTVLVDVPEQVL